MRKFESGRRTLVGVLLSVAILVMLAAFYRVSGPADWTVLVAVLVAGVFLALLWAFARARRQREEHRRYHELYDPLTSLPNRSLFVDHAGHALLQAARESRSVAILLVDLDNFEEINHSLGYEAGDRLLTTVGQRLKEFVGSEEIVARMYGDEFAVLFRDVPDKGSTTSAAKRIGEALRTPTRLDGSEVLVSASVGIAIGGSDIDSPESLLRNADVAMHAAKRKGKAGHAVFDSGADTTTSGRLLLESEMRRAVKEGEFRVYYQPVVALKTGKVRGVEALVRWQHPTYGLIPPGEFIPLAEQTGLIGPIGRWVLREACHQVRIWQREHPRKPPLTLSVNVSACQFQQPNLVEEVIRTLEETGFDPRCLKLEITESIMVHNASATTALRKLKDLGVELAMDDFGTGYSNLSYLKRLPIDTLKIDRSYVGGLGSDAEDTAIVHATVAFAKALDLKVTAEGIENDEQVARLRELGCELGQGYHFAKPLSNEAASSLLATRT